MFLISFYKCIFKNIKDKIISFTFRDLISGANNNLKNKKKLETKLFYY